MATQPVFSFGPDQPLDFRKLRPYFLVPLDDPEEVRAVGERVVRHVEQGPPVSDVYVLSHGWHRNFFSAASAYDRLLSAFSLLMRRHRIETGGRRPLFLAFHWHSDPGEDGWVDAEGRRNLASFLDNAARAFQRPLPQDEAKKLPIDRFSTVFEDIFEHFARLSAPDTCTLTDPHLDSQHDRVLAQLIARLDTFELRDGPDATPAEKITAAWACYQTATPKRRLADQAEPPGRFLGFGTAVGNLLQFVVKVVGIVALVSLLLKVEWVLAAIRWPWDFVQRALAPLTGETRIRVVAFVMVAAFVIAWVHLARTAAKGPGDVLTPGRSVSIFRLACWAYLQLICTVPIVLYAFVTYFMGGFLLGRHLRALRLFDERFGARGGPTSTGPRWQGPRYWLASLARFPIGLLRRSIPGDSNVNLLLDQLDSQLAFWQMQIDGVETGRRGAEFLASVLSKAPSLAGARIHLTGHSFGGLVVSNVVRHLALDSQRSVDTLCLLEAAQGSGWFEHEETVVKHVRGSLACIYSRYDTANSFYYPVANHGRLAAGNVGILGPNGNAPSRIPQIEGSYAELDQGLFASVVTPPDLLGRLKQRAPGGPPWIVNVDASRMIYEGNVAAGGGHGDIFKNDVVLLVWAVTEIR